MQTEIANKQKCIVIRYGIEIWIDEEKWKKLEYALDNQIGQFYDIEGRRVNKADLVGIFYPIDLEEMKRRKNGEFKCSYGQWHNRGEVCECWKKKIDIENDKRLKAMAETGDISEEERINNSKEIQKMKKNIFKD